MSRVESALSKFDSTRYELIWLEIRSELRTIFF